MALFNVGSLNVLSPLDFHRRVRLSLSVSAKSRPGLMAPHRATLTQPTVFCPERGVFPLFRQFCWFSEYMFYVSLITLLPKCFILSEAIVSGSAFLISSFIARCQCVGT